MPNPQIQPPKWPKPTQKKNKYQQEVDVDWQAYFYGINRKQYSAFVNFGHQYVTRHHKPDFVTTLEVGAGVGEHFHYEHLTPEQKKNYWVNEISPEKIKELNQRWPFAKVVDIDCQKKLPFKEGFFDRILAIHVLEHLENLPAFLKEADRLMSPGGQMFVVLPCEGWLYTLIRWFTTQRMFESRYEMPYREYLGFEHINTVAEVVAEVRRVFDIENRHWWPLMLPSHHFNFCLGMVLKKKAGGGAR
jgi:2-polyprenyl-3-methyl-5-hydroxy-6-metoxy-1,4-benzoquinol methylase